MCPVYPENEVSNMADDSSFITTEEALAAHKLLFDKEPDDVGAFARRAHSVAALRAALFESPEFERLVQTYAPNHKPLHGEALDIEVRVPDELLSRMMSRIEGVFSKLGETEPFWAVTTQQQYRSENIDANRDAFFETGIHFINKLNAFAHRSGVNLSAYKRCFELGCGVGRVTLRLASIFSRVIAADISPPLLKHAQMTLIEFGKANVEFLLLNKFNQYGQLPQFDFFVSTITLQHNPPPIMYFMLSSVLDKLNSGGVAFFEIPTYHFDYRFNGEDYLSSPTSTNEGIEMHVLPQKTLFELLDEKNCQLLEFREDGACGSTPAIISNTVFLRKR
jgi:SAM-dependent methyltransferase